MAFGKTKLNVASVGGWRQRREALDNYRKEMRGSGRGGGGGNRFQNIYRPSKGTADLIRVIPGAYKVPRPIELDNGDMGITHDILEYWECIEHRDSRSGRTSICSAGPLWMRKKHAQPCEGCRIYWDAPVVGGKRKSRISRRDISVFTVLQYGPFIKVAQVDGNGVVKTNNEGKPYYEWIPKRAGHPHFEEEKEGHVMHWAVGYGHMGIISGYDDIIGNMCLNCGTEEAVAPLALLCQHCETDIVDCTNTELTPEQQQRLLIEPTECPHCHEVDVLREFLGCSACDNAARTTIFDVDIKAMRMDKGETTQLIFQSWSKPHPIDAAYAEMAKPLPLDKIYVPTSMEKQMEWFGTGQAASPAQHSRQYTR